MYVYNETSLFPFIFGNKYVANGIHRKVPSNDYISYFFWNIYVIVIPLTETKLVSMFIALFLIL